jgi:hypothetical protein
MSNIHGYLEIILGAVIALLIHFALTRSAQVRNRVNAKELSVTQLIYCGLLVGLSNVLAVHLVEWSYPSCLIQPLTGKGIA